MERAADIRTSIAVSAGDAAVGKSIRSIPVADLVYDVNLIARSEAFDDVNGCGPRLGDRVVNIRGVGVPFGLRGTVVVTHSHTGFVEVSDLT